MESQRLDPGNVLRSVLGRGNQAGKTGTAETGRASQAGPANDSSCHVPQPLAEAGCPRVECIGAAAVPGVSESTRCLFLCPARTIGHSLGNERPGTRRTGSCLPGLRTIELTRP